MSAPPWFANGEVRARRDGEFLILVHVYGNGDGFSKLSTGMLVTKILRQRPSLSNNLYEAMRGWNQIFVDQQLVKQTASSSGGAVTHAFANGASGCGVSE
jgi:hypothetical protein